MYHLREIFADTPSDPKRDYTVLWLNEFSQEILHPENGLKRQKIVVALTMFVVSRAGERVLREDLENESKGGAGELSEENGNGHKERIRRGRGKQEVELRRGVSLFSHGDHNDR